MNTEAKEHLEQLHRLAFMEDAFIRKHTNLTTDIAIKFLEWGISYPDLYVKSKQELFEYFILNVYQK